MSGGEKLRWGGAFIDRGARQWRMSPVLNRNESHEGVMRVVRARPGVVLGEHDLFNHQGVGELWCNDWVGVIQIQWPFNPDHFEFVTSVNAGGRDGSQLIVVTDHIRVRLEACPNWAGGWMTDDGEHICFWWRCLLRQGQFRLLSSPPPRENGTDLDWGTNPFSAPPRGGSEGLPAW